MICLITADGTELFADNERQKYGIAYCVIRDPKLKFPWKGILRIYVRDSEESFERDSRVIRSSVRPMCVTVKRKVNKNMTSVNLLARNVCRGVEIFKSS